MSGKDLVPGLLSAAASDLLGALGVGAASTGAAVLGMAISKVIGRRVEAARDILVEELRRGDRMLSAAGEVDAFAAIIFRYARAAQEGTARLNLRLMAKVIAGQAHLGNLVADEFLYYADILASLRREEIILIATLHKYSHDPEVLAEDEGGRTSAAQRKACEELVPGLFATSEEFEAVAGASMRTGLVVGFSGFGAIVYGVSPLMDRLERLAPFQDALRAEATPDSFHAT